MKNRLLLLAAVSSLALTAAAQVDPATCPMHAQHMKDAAAAAVDHRGADAKGMGFSQEATKHTFRLYADGGAIEVRAVDAADRKTIGLIRTHIAEIAKVFPKGDFAKPEYIHGRVPDGVGVMQERLSAITWRYEELETGARLRIRSTDPRAIEAIHAFLRFQITDHHTGDPTKVD